MIYVHLGGGAGDLDPKANYQCGFTKFIKNNAQESDQIIIIEANKNNISQLQKSWTNYPNATILNVAIVSNNFSNKLIKFYYAVDDAPYYQVCSYDLNHVKKHHPHSIIKHFEVECITIDELFNNYIASSTIDYLSIDIEGLDYDLIMSIDFKKYLINNISIEYLHLTKLQKFKMNNYLKKFGFSYCGYGYDYNNYDYLYKRKKIFLNQFLSNFLFIIGKKHLKYFNKLLNC